MYGWEALLKLNDGTLSNNGLTNVTSFDGSATRAIAISDGNIYTTHFQ